MAKRYYTKIRKVLQDSAILRFQATNNEVYIATDCLVVAMPDWLYTEQFELSNEINWTQYFPAINPGERLSLKNGLLVEEGPDLAKYMHDWMYDYRRNYTLAKEGAKGKWHNKAVRFIETGRSVPVLLNNKYYEAMEQATRGSNIYADSRIHPVYFYDAVIAESAFYGCVLPINYGTDVNVVKAT